MNDIKRIEIREIPLEGVPIYQKANNIFDKVVLYTQRKPNKYVTIDKLLYLYPFISRKRVYEIIKYQGLKHIKGKPILIDPIDFEEFLENQKEVQATTIEQEYNKKYGLLNIPDNRKKYV